MKIQDDPFKTVGNSRLSAWAVDENSCWIQARSPAIAKAVTKRVETRRVAHGWPYLVTFEVHRTLPWVTREIVSPITSQFISKIEGGKTGLARS